MDYNQFEKNIYDSYKFKIIEKFKNESEKERPFIKAIDNVTKDILATRSTSIISKNEKLLQNCIYEINQRSEYYKSPDNALKSIISNEIKDSFDEVNEKIMNINNERLNISYEDFIKELITYDCLGRIEKRVKLNFELYKIFYENNDYSHFTLDYFEDHVVNSQLFKKIFIIFNPGKIIPIANKKIDPFNNISYEIAYPDNLKNKSKLLKDENTTINENEITFKLSEFQEEEKYLILHVLYKVIEQKRYDNKNIDLAEFLRTVRICQMLQDITLFEKNYNKKFYKSVSNGLDYYTNSKTKKDLKINLMKKLKELQVPEIYNYIKNL